jgi:hypothetical protein
MPAKDQYDRGDGSPTDAGASAICIGWFEDQRQQNETRADQRLTDSVGRADPEETGQADRSADPISYP